MLVVAALIVEPFTIVFFTTVVGIALARTVFKAVRRGTLMMRGALVVRDGRATLTDEARANLEKRGMDAEKMERLVDKTYTVDASGKIVLRREGSETAPPAQKVLGIKPASPTSSTVPANAKPERPLYRKPSVEDLLGGPRK
ncbi:MAG: hypothetical protein ACYDHO_08775 [Gaiellaceae bacterium]